MRSATLTLTVDFVRAIDGKNLAGHGRFNNGKTLDSISFTAYAPTLARYDRSWCNPSC